VQRPFYEDEGVQIYLGDCREILPALGPADVVIADPPYGETDLDWDVPTAGWLPMLQCYSLWCFGSLRMFMSHAAEFAGWNLAQDIIWEKHNGSNSFADRFRRVHEHIAHFYPMRVPWASIYKSPPTTADARARGVVRRKRKARHWGTIGGSHYTSVDGGPRIMRSVIRVHSCHGYAVHPTQKPVGIVIPLIEYSCQPAGTVLDPFMGSGTTLRAAKDLGRKAIGIEKEERWCDVAVRRMQQEVLPITEVGKVAR